MFKDIELRALDIHFHDRNWMIEAIHNINKCKCLDPDAIRLICGWILHRYAGALAEKIRCLVKVKGSTQRRPPCFTSHGDIVKMNVLLSCEPRLQCCKAMRIRLVCMDGSSGCREFFGNDTHIGPKIQTDVGLGDRRELSVKIRDTHFHATPPKLASRARPDWAVKPVQPEK